MKRLFLSFIILITCVLLFSACASNRQILNEGNLAFNAPKGSLLKNPQSNVARIYVLSVPKSNGGTRSKLTFEWNAEMVKAGEPSRLNRDESIAMLAPAQIFYIDLLPNKPITLTAKLGGLHKVSYVYFTPSASKIYCLAAVPPNLRLVEFKTCEATLKSVQGNIVESRDYQRKWRQEFVKEKSSSLDGKVFWLSYMMDENYDDLSKK